MFLKLLKKLKESLISVLPVVLLVVILNFTPLIDLSLREILVFLVCSVFLIIGIALFSLGADVAMTPMGENVGSGLTKNGSLALLLIIACVLGLLVTVAEPDLAVLANQVSALIKDYTLIIFVSVGVGIFLVLGVLKIIFKKKLSSILLIFYMLLFALCCFVIIQGNERFLSLAFDSGGVTTGPITVPFIMALGVGIASIYSGKEGKENSFGLIALCSIGPILAVMLLGIFADGDLVYSLPDYNLPVDILGDTLSKFLSVVKEVSISLGLIVAFFIVIDLIFLKLSKKRLLVILYGILFTYFGLIIFLTAVNVGFVPLGFKLGQELANSGPIVTTIFGFAVGAMVVLAEPAVQVLNKQVEEITNGTVSKKSMMIALSIGVGVSLALSIIRIYFDFSILYYVIPGYFISLGLSFFVPSLYTAIAFDSGGVASGPLTSSFILPLAIGVCVAFQGEGKVLSDAFGIVAMVAMTPLITIQLLGFRSVVKRKIARKIAMDRVLSEDDNQVINF